MFPVGASKRANTFRLTEARMEIARTCRRFEQGKGREGAFYFVLQVFGISHKPLPPQEGRVGQELYHLDEPFPRYQPHLRVLLPMLAVV